MDASPLSRFGCSLPCQSCLCLCRSTSCTIPPSAALTLPTYDLFGGLARPSACGLWPKAGAGAFLQRAYDSQARSGVHGCP
jgi:hypothetical protein